MSLTKQEITNLKRQYRIVAHKANTPQKKRHAYRVLLSALFHDDGDLRIFHELRHRPRLNGARIDIEFMSRELTVKQAFLQIRSQCQDAYAERLNKYGIVEIDLESRRYRDITREMAYQVLQAFTGVVVDMEDKTEVCTRMARTWHQFVRALHAEYGLPGARKIQRGTSDESEAETNVIASNKFITQMTQSERVEWARKVQ